MEIINKPQQDLPNASAILILGILSLVFCLSTLGLVLGIIALVMANTQRKVYFRSPGEYTETSFKNVNTGRICSIIAIWIAAVIFLFFMLVVFGVIALGISLANIGM